jgi:nucleoside-diphosphate-sugar epimerase
MSNRVVVIGHTGFIGKAIFNNLISKHINCIGLSSNEANLLLEEGITYIKEKINKNDSIIFVSALAPCKDFDMYNKNLIMINNFIKSISNKTLNHILYVSSDAIYQDSMDLITEEQSKNIDNLHAKMHVDREKILNLHCSNREIDLTIVRPTLVYGPGDTHNGYGPNKFIRDINSGKEIVLFGKGEERRDHIFIDDLVDIVIYCMNNKIFGDFTLASGNVISFYDIAKIICDLKNIDFRKIQFLHRKSPMPHNGYRAFNIDKLKKNIPELIITDIKTGLEKTINELFY